MPCRACTTFTAAWAKTPKAKPIIFTNETPKPKVPHASWRILRDLLFRKSPDSVPKQAIPVQTITGAQLAAAPDLSLFRLGHSTLLLKLRGKFFLTDPVFAQRASPLRWLGPKRFHAPPISLEDLPPLEAVILSHNHYDHLDRAAVKALAAKTQVFLAPLGVGDTLKFWGIPAAQVREFNWWQGGNFAGIEFIATPAQHFSGRHLWDGNTSLWCSWVIIDGSTRVFFSGDSGYFSGFKTIGERFGPFDITLMETGAYNASWAYVHMHPEETLQAHKDLNGNWLLPIHNGTFDLSLHAWWEPFERISALADAEGIHLATPQMGESFLIDQPQQTMRWWKAVMN